MNIIKNEIKDKINVPIQKETVVRCVSAVVCTGIVCGSAVKCADTVAETVKETSQDAEQAVSDVIGVAVNDNSSAVEVTTEHTEYSQIDVTSQTSEITDSITENTSEVKTTYTTGEKSLSTAEIIKKFNDSANKIKTGSKSVKQNYCKKTQITTPKISNSIVKSVANSLIKANMGDDENKKNAVYSTSEDKNINFPVAGQNYVSKLTENDVKSASITTSGNTDIITIKVKNDTEPNTGTYAKKAFSVVTKEQIIEGAGSTGMKFIDEASIKLYYSNGVIKAKIDNKTGNIIDINYYIEWELALTTTVGNMDIAISFGMDEDYTINW